MQLLKSHFKRTINWNKYQRKVRVQEQNPYLDFLIDRSFQGALIEFLFYHLKIMVVEQITQDITFTSRNKWLYCYDRWTKRFQSTSKNKLITYDINRKIATGQGNDYTTGCLLDYPYFKNYFTMIAVDLSKQQALDADSKSIQETNLTVNLDRAGNTTMFSLWKKQK